MVYFTSDYSAGAHPEVLKRLCDTNCEHTPGYGEDAYCAAAKEKIRKEAGCPDAEIEFLVGGTQTNAAVISTVLRDFEGVISADTGHIHVHEAGAVEYTGHKVLTVPHKEGKITAEALSRFLDAHEAEPSREHTVFPGMVYISHPTELGTLYSKRELEELSGICRGRGLTLFLDGARLCYGLMSGKSDMTLPDIARLCDVFTVGGTKAGALFGEAVVFTRGNRPAHFMNSVKKRGAMLAKGRLLGVQFDALFTDGLFWRIGKKADEKAMRMREVFSRHGIGFFIESYTNQQFVVLDAGVAAELGKSIAFEIWEKLDDSRVAVRFVTGWTACDGDIDALDRALTEAVPGV